MESELSRTYRAKAASLRATAAAILNPLTRNSLIREAELYERLAEAEERTRPSLTDAPAKQR